MYLKGLKWIDGDKKIAQLIYYDFFYKQSIVYNDNIIINQQGWASTSTMYYNKCHIFANILPIKGKVIKSNILWLFKTITGIQIKLFYKKQPTTFTHRNTTRVVTS